MHVVHDITYWLCKVLLGVTVAFHVDRSCKRVFLWCTVDRLQRNRYRSSQLKYRVEWPEVPTICPQKRIGRLCERNP